MGRGEMGSLAEPNRKAFSDTLLALAEANPDILALTSDSRGSASLNQFASVLPRQLIEAGIAEQNIVGMAAGLAKSGKVPFVCSPAAFLSMRSIEQIKVDCAYSGANVKLIGISGGVSYGALGATHHSLQDLAVMRSIPGLTVVVPSDNQQTAELTSQIAYMEGPVYMRLGRQAVPSVHGPHMPSQLGRGLMLQDGQDLTLIGAGEVMPGVLEAAHMLEDGLGAAVRVVEIHTIKPLDEEIIMAAAETRAVVVVEEHSVHGGLGSACASVLSQFCPVPVCILGIPDEPPVTGSQSEIFRHYGLDAEGIHSRIAAFWQQLQRQRRRG